MFVRSAAKFGLNQSQFWSKIGVTQSGGRATRAGATFRAPGAGLLRLVHVEQIDINKVKRDDVDVAEYLKATNPRALQDPQEGSTRQAQGALSACRPHSRADAHRQPFFSRYARRSPPSSSALASAEMRAPRAASTGRAMPYSEHPLQAHRCRPPRAARVRRRLPPLEGSSPSHGHAGLHPGRAQSCARARLRATASGSKRTPLMRSIASAAAAIHLEPHLSARLAQAGARPPAHAPAPSGCRW